MDRIAFWGGKRTSRGLVGGALGSAGLLAVFLAAPACSDPAPPVPRAYVVSRVEPGNSADTASSICHLAPGENWITIRTADQKAVSDGDTLEGDGVRVDCTVAPSGSNFTINLEALLNDPTSSNPGSPPGHGGSVRITGTVGATGQQSKISAKFQRADTDTFTGEDCTIDYPDSMSIGAGRIRGTLNCGKVTSTKGTGRACSATAQFVFEHCVNM